MNSPTHGNPHGSDRSLSAAVHDLVTAIEPISGYHRVALRAALGRILAEPLRTAVSVPAHDNSAVDGYALRHADAGHVPLQQVGTAAAGHPYTGTLGAGECVRIMTGAVVPAGADAVVMQERVSRDGDAITPEPWPPAGNNIRRAGAEYVLGVPTISGRLLVSEVLQEPVVGVDRQTRTVHIDGGRFAGQQIGETPLPAANCVVVAVERDGAFLIDLTEGFEIRSDDQLVVVGQDDAIGALG